MHWVAPTIMLATFAIGVALAIGHHFFYKSLDGTVVADQSFSQQVNIGIGTAFTFLVKALLLTAVGVAYTQVLWRRLRSKSNKIARIDSLAVLLSSLWDVLNLKLLWQNPALAGLAIVSWTLPIATIVPPATLSVHTALDYVEINDMMALPAVDFGKNQSFANLYGASGGGSFFAAQADYLYYGGAQTNLTRLATSTATQGQILQLNPPAVNSSYSSKFYAPAVQCQLAPVSILENFTDVFGTDIINDERGVTHWSYLAWVPGPDAIVPFGNGSKETMFTTAYLPDGSGSATFGGVDGYPAAIYVAARPMLYPNSWKVLNCSLFNASYQVDYSFENGRQTINSSYQLLNGVSAARELGILGAGQGSTFDPNQTTQYYVTSDHISYQAVMDSVCQILVGQITEVSADSMGDYWSSTATSIRSTNLQYSPEIGGMNQSKPLGDQIAELFQNITLGLLSVSDFVSTGIDADGFENANAHTNLTILTLPNVYVYAWHKLVLAYGLAVLFAAIAVLFGIFALLATGESYTTNFSTILRTTRDFEIEGLVAEDDQGADPLPKCLAKIKLQLGSHQDGRQEGARDDGMHGESDGAPVIDSQMSLVESQDPHLGLIQMTGPDKAMKNQTTVVVNETNGSYQRISRSDPVWYRPAEMTQTRIPRKPVPIHSSSSSISSLHSVEHS